MLFEPYLRFHFFNSRLGKSVAALLMFPRFAAVLLILKHWITETIPLPTRGQILLLFSNIYCFS